MAKRHTGNGDNVGRDVGRHVTTLSLDDGQSSERTTAELVVHLSRTLEKTGVQIEDISGVGLSAWRPPQEETHLAVGDSLLGQIIVDDQSVLAVVAEPEGEYVRCENENSKSGNMEVNRSKTGDVVQ